MTPREEAIDEHVRALCEWECTWREYRNARLRINNELRNEGVSFIGCGPHDSERDW